MVDIIDLKLDVVSGCETGQMKINAVLFDMFDTLMMIERDHAFYSPSLKQAYVYVRERGVKTTFREFERAYVKARDALYAEADQKMEEPHFNLRIANALTQLGYSYPVSSDVVIGATNAFCEAFMKYVRVDEAAIASLKKLHGKYRLGIVSNFAIPECVTKLLNEYGLTELFDVIIVSGAVNKRKPSPEIYRKALDVLGVRAQNAVFVGDTADADIAGPKSIGMRTVYIERRAQEMPKDACPDQTIKTMSDLLPALERC